MSHEWTNAERKRQSVRMALAHKSGKIRKGILAARRAREREATAQKAKAHRATKHHKSHLRVDHTVSPTTAPANAKPIATFEALKTITKELRQKRNQLDQAITALEQTS